MYNIINICLVCVCNSIIIMTENEVELSYGRAIYERIDLLDLLDDDLSDIYIITGHRQSLRKCACTCVYVCCMYHSILTFVRTIFPGVWDVSVMRHGGQASDEIEDDLYQYNII